MPITPHIVVQGAERAVTFYRDAFGAEEIDRIPTPDGRLMSVQLRLGDGLLHVADEFPEMGVLAPPSIGGTPVVLSLEVADADAVFARAVAAGAERRASRRRTCSGAIATASSRIPSATAGTSASTCAMSRTTRSWPRPLRCSPETMPADYQRPGWFTKHVFNPIVGGLTRLGVSLVGSRVLEVRGRKSGEWRRTPVNPLEFEGERYIVSPRGETQWVRNLRASGQGRLRKGLGREEFTATELPDEEKLPLLRAYLKKWAWEVGAFFQGVGADAPDDDLRRIAPLHPVFRISSSR